MIPLLITYCLIALCVRAVETYICSNQSGYSCDLISEPEKEKIPVIVESEESSSFFSFVISLLRISNQHFGHKSLRPISHTSNMAPHLKQKHID